MKLKTNHEISFSFMYKDHFNVHLYYFGGEFRCSVSTRHTSQPSRIICTVYYHSLTLKIILSGADKEWDQELVREGGDTFFHLFRGDGGVRVNCPSI